MLSSSSPCSSDLANFASPDPKNAAWKENTPAEVNDEPLTPIPKNRGNLVSTACPSCHAEVLVDDLSRHLETHTAKQRREAGVTRREGGTPLRPLNGPNSSDTRTTSRDFFEQKFRGFQPRPELSIDVKRNLFGDMQERQAVDDDIGFKMRDFDTQYEIQGDFGRLSESFSFGRRDTPRLSRDLDNTTAKEQQQGSTHTPPASATLYARQSKWYASHVMTQSPQCVSESAAKKTSRPVEETFWCSVGARHANIASGHDVGKNEQVCARSATFGTDHEPIDEYCRGRMLASQRSDAQDKKQSNHHSDSSSSSRERSENAPRRNRDALIRSATVPTLAQVANDGNSATIRHLSLPPTPSRRESHHSKNELLNDKLDVGNQDDAVQIHQPSVDLRGPSPRVPLALSTPTIDTSLFDVSIEVRVTPVARAHSTANEEQPRHADDNSAGSTATNPKKRRRGLSFSDFGTEPSDILHPRVSSPTMTSRTRENPSPHHNVCSYIPIGTTAATAKLQEAHVPSYGVTTQYANDAFFLSSSKANNANSMTREKVLFANCGPDSEAAREQAKAFFRTPSSPRPVQLQALSALPNLISLNSTPSDGGYVTPFAGPSAYKHNDSTLNENLGPYRDLLSSSDKLLSPHNPVYTDPPTALPSTYVDLLELHSTTSSYFATSPHNEQTPVPLVTSPQRDFLGHASLSYELGVQNPIAVDARFNLVSPAGKASLIPSPVSSPSVPSLLSAEAERSRHASPILKESPLPSSTELRRETCLSSTERQLSGINPIVTEGAQSVPHSTFTEPHSGDAFYPKQQEELIAFSDILCSNALFDATQSFYSGHGSNVTPRNGIVKKNRHCLQETHTTVPWDNSTSLLEWSFNDSTRNEEMASRVTPRVLQSARVALRSSLVNETTFLPLPTDIGDTFTYADDASGASKQMDTISSRYDPVLQSHNPADKPLPKLDHADEVRQSKLIILKAKKNKKQQNTVSDAPPAEVPHKPPPPETTNSHELVSCPHCPRKFLQVALKRHLPVCLKVFGTVRDPVDFRAKRAKDTPLEYFVPGTSKSASKGINGSLNTSMRSNLDSSMRSQSMPHASARGAKLTPSTFRSKGTYPCTPSVCSTSFQAPSLSTSTTARSKRERTPNSTSTYKASAAARKDHIEHQKVLDSARRTLVMDGDDPITTAAKAKPKCGLRPNRSTLPARVPTMSSDAPLRWRMPNAKAKTVVIPKTPGASSSQPFGQATSSGSRGGTEKHGLNRQSSKPRASAGQDTRQTRRMPSPLSSKTNIPKAVTPARRAINPQCEKKNAAPHAKTQESVKHVIQEKENRHQTQMLVRNGALSRQKRPDAGKVLTSREDSTSRLAPVGSGVSSRQKRPDDEKVLTSREDSANRLAPVGFCSTNQCNETPSDSSTNQNNATMIDALDAQAIYARDVAQRGHTSARHTSPDELLGTYAHDLPFDDSSLLSTSAHDATPLGHTPPTKLSTTSALELPLDASSLLCTSARDEARDEARQGNASPRKLSMISTHDLTLDESSSPYTSARDLVPRDETLAQCTSLEDAFRPITRDAPPESSTFPSTFLHDDAPPTSTSTRHTSQQDTSGQGPVSMLERPRTYAAKLCTSSRVASSERGVPCKNLPTRYGIPENQGSVWKAPCHNAPTRYVSQRDTTQAQGAQDENKSCGPKHFTPSSLCEDEVSCIRPPIGSTASDLWAQTCKTHARYRDTESPPSPSVNQAETTYLSARSSLDLARDAMRRHAPEGELTEIPRPLLNESRRGNMDVSPSQVTRLLHGSSPLRHPSTPMRWGNTHLSPESVAFRKRRESHEEWHGATVSSRLVDLQTEMSLLEDRLIRPKIRAPAENALSQLSEETKALTERVDRLLRRSPLTPEAAVSKQLDVSTEKTSTLRLAEAARYNPSRYVANK